MLVSVLDWPRGLPLGRWQQGINPAPILSLWKAKKKKKNCKAVFLLVTNAYNRCKWSDPGFVAQLCKVKLYCLFLSSLS